jgi:hypothetical protein
MRRILQLLVLLTFLAFPLGDARADEFAAIDTTVARRLYRTKCLRCHKEYNPANYSDTAWRDWMDKMSKKAKLKPDQKELLTRYLDDVRKQKQNAQHNSNIEQPSH